MIQIIDDCIQTAQQNEIRGLHERGQGMADGKGLNELFRQAIVDGFEQGFAKTKKTEEETEKANQNAEDKGKTANQKAEEKQERAAKGQAQVESRTEGNFKHVVDVTGGIEVSGQDFANKLRTDVMKIVQDAFTNLDKGMTGVAAVNAANSKDNAGKE